ncbi:MAG: DinB family protein [Chloroflexi bacterium]|nr:DinB family protein [Chloroflexota bacterium]
MTPEERIQKIERYGDGFELLATTLAECPDEALKFKPTPTEWSIHEIIIHIADSESNAALRARMLAAEPSGTIMGYDQDIWANELGYHDQNAEYALQITKYTRLATYKWLKTLPSEIFTHAVKHPEYDQPYTFEMWLNIYSEHIPEHIQQIENNIKIWRKEK